MTKKVVRGKFNRPKFMGVYENNPRWSGQYFRYYDLQFPVEAFDDAVDEGWGEKMILNPKQIYDPEIQVDLDYIKKVKLSKNDPVYVGTLIDPKDGQLFEFPIDGNHRIYKAYKSGRKTIHCILFNLEETLALVEGLTRKERRDMVRTGKREGYLP